MRLCRGASQSSTSPVAARARPPGAPSDSGAAPAASAPASPGAGAATSQAKVVDKKVLAESRWMRFVDIHYTVDGGATQRTWQAAERTTTAPGAVDAVAAFTVIKRTGEEPKLLIVKQFRPPIGRYTVELCAGLIDAGETPEVAAIRELKEETGYTGKVVASTGRQYLSPGLTPENIVTVFVEVDGDAPENQHPVQQDEDAGLITLGTLPVTDLLAELNKLESEGYAVWVGLWNIAMGMSLSSFMPGLVKQPAA